MLFGALSIAVIVLLFNIVGSLLNSRAVTEQDYLYFQSSYGLVGIGQNTQYEIGSIKSSYKYKNKLDEVSLGSEYNKLDDSIYILQTTGCVIPVLSRNGQHDELNYCRVKHKSVRYEATAIFFDKKNYKYVLLNGGFGGSDKYINAIAIFNDRQELIKVINSDLFITSLVTLDDKLVYAQSPIGDGGREAAKYLTTYDLKNNKSRTIDYSVKNKNLFSIGTLMQLDNDYLISYQGEDNFNYVITSKGKVLNKSRKGLSAYKPSYYINGKWYLDVILFKEPVGKNIALIEYTKDSFKTIEHLKICDRYNDLMFNNKSVYCIDKKDDKKIISVLNNDKNTYKLDKKYVYGTYHRLALFGFK